METPVQVVHVLSPALAAALVASVWQALLLTGAVALAMHGLRATSPAARTWVWRALLLVVLMLPVLALLLPHTRTGGHRGLHANEGWSVALIALWGVCSAWRGWRFAQNAIRLYRLTRRAVPVAVGRELQSLLAAPRRIQLCVSAEVNRPSVAGFFRSRVLLPEGLLEALSPAELEHVVRHEVEHLRRGDDWFDLLQEIGLVLFPLNPALLWLDRRMCRERELACDDGVLQAMRSGTAYAACLVKLAEDSLHRRGAALALSALGSELVSGFRGGRRESELVGRVRRILAGPDRRTAGMHVRLTVGALTVATVAGAVVLAGSPAWVSFDEVSPQGARSVVAGAIGSPLTPPRVPAFTLAAGGGGDRPVLAKVAMHRAGVATLRAAVAHASRRRGRPQVLPVKAAVDAAKPWRALPPETAVETAAGFAAGFAAGVPSGLPRMRPATLSGADPSAARAVVTEFDVSQPMYAAVRWAGGWLIVQL